MIVHCKDYNLIIISIDKFMEYWTKHGICNYNFSGAAQGRCLQDLYCGVSHSHHMWTTIRKFVMMTSLSFVAITRLVDLLSQVDVLVL